MATQDWSTYLTTGVQVSSGDVPIRKELRSLTPEEMWLYTEGLKKFQLADHDDPNSYYQIAGIHGLPYQDWPYAGWNDPPVKPREDSSFQGFCTHNSIIFLTWHRPYLALFEQHLYKHVNDIAEGIMDSSEKAKYVPMAKQFRMPYWDWAARNVSPIFPEVALWDNDSFNGPESSASVPGKWNPLYEAPFPSQWNVPKDILGKGTNATVRYPGIQDAEVELQAAVTNFYKAPAQQIPDVVPGMNLTERVAYILLSYDKYGPMSNNKYRGPSSSQVITKPENFGSFEDFHNSIHDITGGPDGHMSQIETSGFDPIFWLHHTNIDRLFDIWQALHWQNEPNTDTWVTEQLAGKGNISVPAGDPENATTPLYPFRPSTTELYDSNGVHQTESFGYSYAETAGLKYPTNDTQKGALKKIVEELYISPAKMIRMSKAGDQNAAKELLRQAQMLKSIESAPKANIPTMKQVLSDIPESQTLLKRSLEPSKPLIKSLAPNNKYLEWLVNIKAQKHALGGDYSVHVFLDPPGDDDIALWPISPHYVGTFVPLGQGEGTSCGKCKRDQADNVEITSQIPLTVALFERYLAEILPNLDVDTVVNYLKKNLHWRVVANRSILENRSDINGLTVFVVSNEVTLPEDPNQLPIYDPGVVIYPEITTNRDGNGRGEGTGLTQDQVP